MLNWVNSTTFTQGNTCVWENKGTQCPLNLDNTECPLGTLQAKAQECNCGVLFQNQLSNCVLAHLHHTAAGSLLLWTCLGCMLWPNELLKERADDKLMKITGLHSPRSVFSSNLSQISDRQAQLIILLCIFVVNRQLSTGPHQIWNPGRAFSSCCVCVVGGGVLPTGNQDIDAVWYPTELSITGFSHLDHWVTEGTQI